MSRSATYTARADQMAAQVRDARCCDALTPCRRCVVTATTVHVLRRLADTAPGRVRAAA